MNENLPPVEPAAPKKNNTTLIIIIVVVVLLCCCCAVLGVLGWNYGDQIMNSLGMY
jgi:flagellar basal body-associated protein FliL